MENLWKPMVYEENMGSINDLCGKPIVYVKKPLIFHIELLVFTIFPAQLPFVARHRCHWVAATLLQWQRLWTFCDPSPRWSSCVPMQGRAWLAAKKAPDETMAVGENGGSRCISHVWKPWNMIFGVMEYFFCELLCASSFEPIKPDQTWGV